MIRFFANHPTAANLLVLGFIVLGLMAAPSVKRETFPDIPPDQVEVRVVYKGASADEVETAVCRRIEDAVDGVADLKELRCEARESLAIATAEMQEGVDFDRFLNDVKTEVEAIDSFPSTVEAPVIRQLGRTDYVASVAVTGPMSAPDLKSYAEVLKDGLAAIPEISRVSIRGFSDRQIRIQVPLDTLRQYGLSVAAIADVIGRQSVNLPAGTIEATDREVLIRFDDERRSPRAFADLVVVAGAGGAEIRLGDIATITDTFELAEDRRLFNGRRAAYLVVEKAKDEDTLNVVGAINAFVDRHEQLAPPDVTLTVTEDISSIVRDRLQMLIKNGFQGLVLVFLTMWLFFSFRFSFWVAACLPVSFLGTIFAMSMIGYSFDMLTMVGLLIAVGLIVDDSIVIAENIAAHMRGGEPPLSAAVTGALQVAPGVIASFLTTVCIFGSLAFLKGDIGNIMKVMPIVLILTVSISIIEAFLVLPHHLGHALGHVAQLEPPAFRRRLEAAVAWMREALIGRMVDWAVRWRYLAVGLVLALMLASVGMLAGGVLKFSVFPDLEGNVVVARILLPQGTPLARTEQVVERVVAAARAIDAEETPNQPAGQPLIENLGVQYNTNTDAYESGPHLATVSIDLLGSEIRTVRVDDFLNRWRHDVGPVPDVISLKFTERQLGPGGRAIDIQLRGDDLDRLKAAALELQGWFGRYRGVSDLSDDLRPGKPEIRLRLREGAVAMGLTARDIANQLRSAYFGQTAAEIQVGSESYDVDVQLAAADQDSLADLEYFFVTTPRGGRVPLGAVAEIVAGRGWARIARVDGHRTVSVQGEVDTAVANADEIVRDTRDRFLPTLAARYPGVTFALEGQAEETATTGASLRNGFLVGLVGVYILLSFLFRSYIEPLVVMIAIPLGFIGVVWGHLLLGLDLSMPSMVGFASLAGVVVNNGILLVAFLKMRMAEGAAVADATRMASRQRFRAILLTSLTTVMGMLPLMLETSLQAQVLVPLVASLVFGMITATGLVLIIVPALFTILDDFGLVAGHKRMRAAATSATTPSVS